MSEKKRDRFVKWNMSKLGKHPGKGSVITNHKYLGSCKH